MCKQHLVSSYIQNITTVFLRITVKIREFHSTLFEEYSLHPVTYNTLKEFCYTPITPWEFCIIKM